MERVYQHARLLCKQLGETARLCPTPFGLWRSHYVRAQMRSARQLGEQLLSLAAGQQDFALLIEAHGALGQTLCIQDELVPAREHLARVRRLYNLGLHYPLALRYGYDPGVYAHAMQGWVLWLLGYPAQALRCGDEALALTRELSHPFTVSFTLAMVAVIQQMCRRGQSTQQLAAASLAISTDQNFPYLHAVGTIVHGRGLVEQGQIEAGIAQMDRRLGASQAAGIKILRHYVLALLTKACGQAGHVGTGLNYLAEAIAAAELHGERFYEAELYRLRGELSSRQTAVNVPKLPEPGEVGPCSRSQRDTLLHNYHKFAPGLASPPPSFDPAPEQ